MTTWSADELAAIEQAEELEVITLGTDGSARKPVPIWVVRVGDAVYVRSYRGEAGAWYRHAAADRSGRVRVAGIERDVLFRPVEDETTSEAIDRTYERKYARYGDSYLKPMIAPAAKAATLRLTPRAQ
jgi:hypothetical protein